MGWAFFPLLQHRWTAISIAINREKTNKLSRVYTEPVQLTCSMYQSADLLPGGIRGKIRVGALDLFILSMSKG
jgi:hypothetical protein